MAADCPPLGTLAGVSELAHRHGSRVHSHAYSTPHRHPVLPWRSRLVEQPDDHSHDEHDDQTTTDNGHSHAHGEHGHSHGLVDRSIVRSREGVKAVSISLAVLGVAAVAQTGVFVLSGSVALLADLIHNFGDALTAVPLGIAFFLRSFRGEKFAGLVRRRSRSSCRPASPSTKRSSGSSTRRS